jgi:hypothetical protein
MKYTVCIYCGSSDEASSSFRAAAAGAVKALAAGGADLIYGGGFHGLMGEVARASLEAGVPLTGIVPARFKSDRSIPPKGIEYRFVDTMQERKTLMRDLSQGFVALPGGIGTLDEILETLMMRSLGFHAKPLALLNARGFFDPLLSMLERLVSENFLKASIYESLIVSEDAADLAGRLFAALG